MPGSMLITLASLFQNDPGKICKRISGLNNFKINMSEMAFCVFIFLVVSLLYFLSPTMKHLPLQVSTIVLMLEFKEENVVSPQECTMSTARSCIYSS